MQEISQNLKSQLSKICENGKENLESFSNSEMALCSKENKMLKEANKTYKN